jgi:outer membrane biosynthesis protein TonB
MNTKYLLARYNELTGKNLQRWSGKVSDLAAKVEALEAKAPQPSADEHPAAEPTPAPVQPETPATPAQPKRKTMSKEAKPAKKAAKKVAKKAPATRKEGTLSAFVLALTEKGKGVAEILEAAAAKGFETTYGSISSIRSKAKVA